MRTSVAAVILFFGLLARVAAAQTADETPAKPDVSHVKTFHNVGPLKGLTFATDADAQKLEDELLGYLGLHADYQIYVTDNANTTANAAAGYDSASKTRFLFFNRAFMQKYQETAHSDLGIYFIVAHETAHLIALHALRNIEPNQKEIEADYYAGFILGVKTSDCDRVVAAISAFPDQTAHERTGTHPALAQRRVAVGRGCADATGQLAPALDNVSVHANVPSILSQYTTKANRDIYGNDLALIAGRPGIPGSTLESCAHVCFGLPSCKGFTFNSWKNFCYPKGDLKSETFLHPAGIVGVKKSLAIPAVSPSAELTVAYLANTLFADQPLTEETTADYSECRKSCLTSKHCIAFSYFRAKSSCKQFNVTQGYYHDDGFDSGYKYQLPETSWASQVRGR